MFYPIDVPYSGQELQFLTSADKKALEGEVILSHGKFGPVQRYSRIYIYDTRVTPEALLEVRNH